VRAGVRRPRIIRRGEALKPIRYQMPEYQQLSGVMPEIILREFRGANTLDPFSIDDSFFTDMSNLMTDDYPTATDRRC